MDVALKSEEQKRRYFLEWTAKTQKGKCIHFNRLSISFHNVSTNVDK